MVTSAQQLLADAHMRLTELLRASPAADLERNLKALLAQTFQKIELVTRDEFEVERERLIRLQARIEALERELGVAAGARVQAPASRSSGTDDLAGSPSDTTPPANPYQMPPSGAR